MPDPLSVGIAMPSNVKGGPQKVAAIMAADLARAGHKVTIFVTVLPHYFFLVSLGKRPLRRLRWLRYVLPYLKDWAGERKFSFQELLDDPAINKRVSVRFVPRAASRRQLEKLDCLMLHSIPQVVEYAGRYPPSRQLCLLHHPHEHDHGHPETFRRLRGSYTGKLLVISPFTARALAAEIPNLPVVLNPVSSEVWAQREAFDPEIGRRDILLFWKNHESGPRGCEIVEELQRQRPETTVTVWCRGAGSRAAAQQALPSAKIVEDVTEAQLIDVFLGHSLLLFCSTYEGFGMPPIEALACGCIPVLYPEVGAAELYARDGQNCIYLNGDQSEVAGRLAAVLEDDQALQAMRRAAPASIEAFNPEGYGQRILKAAGFL